MAKDDLGVDYQRAGQVRQLLAERELAGIYGQTGRVAAADKQLAELGFTRDEATPAVSRSTPPVGRAARQDQMAKTAAPRPAAPAGKGVG